MIYFNGEEFDVSNEDKDYKFAALVTDYHEYIKSLRERFGNSVVYVTRQKPKRDEKTNNLRPVPLKSWPKEQSGIRLSIKGKDKPMGPYSMIYNKEQVLIKDKIPQLQEKNFIVREGEHTVDLDRDPDFAYFLQFHNVVRSGEFYIYDPARTATEKATQYKREQKVRDLIFSDYSPLIKDIEKMKKVARRWGMMGVDKMTEDQLSTSLFELVMSNEEAKKRNPHLRGVAEFLKDTQLGAGVKAGELVALAEEKGVLKYNKTHGEYEIFYPGRLAATPYFPIPHDKVHAMREFLIEALIMDDQLMRKLEGILGVEADKREVGFEIDRLDDYKYQELQSIANSLGVKPIGKKQEALKAEIREAYAEQ